MVVAFSGGGDSLALLLMAKAWADGAGRPVLALTVDHALQAPSAGWAAWCAARCATLRIEHQILAWTGPKPRSGLPAAARAARHTLIAEAARQAGAVAVVMGHTADDLMEGAAMRAAGSFVADPAPWAPSPAWPGGRGVFILRPLLGLRRAALRDGLRTAGEEGWIEDPTNDDPRHPRARARALLASGSDQADAAPGPLLREANVPSPPDLGATGVFRRRGLTRGVVGAAATCAGGRAAPPRGVALDRLMVRLAGEARFTAALAGARIEAFADRVTFVREAGDLVRAGADAPVPLPPGEAVVWDGRWAITTREAGLAVAPLAGRAARLDREARRALEAVPARVRPTLPAVIDGTDRTTSPALADDPRVTARDLTGERLAAALGAVPDEAAAWRMAKRRAIT